MWRTPTKLLLLLLAGVGAAGVAPPPAQAQTQGAGDSPLVYRREVFRYPRGGRPDPFRSLLKAEDLGFRIEDMQLTGIIFSPEARRSVAVLTEGVSKKRFRLKVGERVGGITVAAIHPRRVDVVVNEFGVIRRESLHLKRPAIIPQEEGTDQVAPPPPPQPQRQPQQQPRPSTGAEAQKGSGR